MKILNVPPKDQVGPGGQVLFDEVTRHAGKLPNMYPTMGYSQGAFKGCLPFEAAMDDGFFSAKEKEAINLVVSQVDSCNYCLAVHTMIAISKGFSHEETMSIRRGHTEDEKLNAAVCLAKSLARNRGEVDEELLQEFFAAGYQEAAFIEFVELVTAKIFTNYLFAVAKVPIDFPEAEPLTRMDAVVFINN
jgi:AhpD family alkylhydroperoxidase